MLAVMKAEKNKTKKKQYQEQYKKLVEQIKNTFTKEMYERSTVGSISEIYDSAKPYEAKGCFAQGWSVAEIFRIIIKSNEM